MQRIRAYHGGPSYIEKFDPARRGARTNANNSRQAYFFAADEADARAYGPAITPTDITVRNPLTIEGPIRDNSTRQLGDAMSAGHDAVIFTDGGKPYAYAVFSEDSLMPVLRKIGEPK